jgi:hypothetical protein
MHASYPSKAAPAARAERSGRWGARRAGALALGSVIVLAALAALTASGYALGYDQTDRDSRGDVAISDESTYSTDSYALVSEGYGTGGAGGSFERRLLGTIRIRTRSAGPVFVGVARASAVDHYLSAVRRDVTDWFSGDRSGFHLPMPSAPARRPSPGRRSPATGASC